MKVEVREMYKTMSKEEIKARDYGTITEMAKRKADKLEKKLDRAEKKYGFWDERVKKIQVQYTEAMNEYYGLLV